MQISSPIAAAFIVYALPSVVFAETVPPDLHPTDSDAGEEGTESPNPTPPPPAQEAPPATVAPSDAEGPDAPAKQPPGPKKKKKFRISARVHVAWEMTHEDTPDNPDTEDDESARQGVENRFDIRRARFKIIWTPEPWLRAVVQVGGFQDNDFGISLLRSAYIHVSPLRTLEIRAGLFKKPFSRLELRSSGKLRVLNRGELNKRLVEELRYGERDLGLQISGRIAPDIKLDYEIGVFNGNGPDVSERGNSKDLVARIKTTPFRMLSIGASASFKFFDDDALEEPFGWAAGADAVIRAFGFTLHMEGMFGEDYFFRNRRYVVTETPPLVLGFVAILSYKHTVSDRGSGIGIEPVFKTELFDPNHKIAGDQVLVFDAGLNTYFGKYLRLMIHGEFRRPAANSVVEFPQSEILAVQLCFDI